MTTRHGTRIVVALSAAGVLGAILPSSPATAANIQAGSSPASATISRPTESRASAKPINKHFTFSKKHQSFRYANSAGSLAAQIGVSKASVRRKGYPMPWSFVIASRLASLATNKATCVAGNLQLKSYHDTHVIWPGYTWHSTVKPHKIKKDYTLWGSCKFPVRVGGRPGIATVSFSFRYRVDPNARTSVSATTPAFTATSKITFS